MGLSGFYNTCSFQRILIYKVTLKLNKTYIKICIPQLVESYDIVEVVGIVWSHLLSISLGIISLHSYGLNEKPQGSFLSELKACNLLKLKCV